MAAEVGLDPAPAVLTMRDAKARLGELQAESRLRTGQTVTQQDLLTRLIDDASESRDAVIDSVRETTVPLSDADTEAMRRDRFRSGVGTDIADILYG